MEKNVILTLAIILMASGVSAFEFCEDGQVGENDLRLISVDDMLKENSKEWVWQTSQEIELETRVENKNEEDGDYVIEIVFKDGDDTIEIAKDSDDLIKEFSLDSEERKSISLTFQVDKDAEAEEYDVYIKFYKEDEEESECVENSEEELIIEKLEVCEDGEVDEDKLEVIRIKDQLDDNEDKWNWAPGNDLSISVEAENKDYSQRNFIVELVLFDKDGEEVSFSEDSKDIEEDLELEEGEDDKINFEFRLSSDIEEGKYSLYAKIYDEDDSDICTSLKAEQQSSPVLIEVEKEERKVIVTEVEGPGEANIYESLEYTVRIANLGILDEDSVSVIAYNREMDLNERIEVNNLGSGEEETVTFSITIPENISLSRHLILFATEYEYNEEQDYYRSASHEDDDIKHAITISEGEIEEEQEEAIEENNLTVEEVSNETFEPVTTITGNAIGVPNKSPNWIMLVLLLILAGIGIFLFFKKPYKKVKPKNEAAPTIRRHTVKIN